MYYEDKNEINKFNIVDKKIEIFLINLKFLLIDNYINFFIIFLNLVKIKK